VPDIFFFIYRLLIPKLQSDFAEFLQDDYLKRLSIFYLKTCVGFSTVLYNIFQLKINKFYKIKNYFIISFIFYINSSIDFFLILETVLPNNVQRSICDLFFSAEMIKTFHFATHVSIIYSDIFTIKYYTYFLFHLLNVPLPFSTYSRLMT